MVIIYLLSVERRKEDRGEEEVPPSYFGAISGGGSNRSQKMRRAFFLLAPLALLALLAMLGATDASTAHQVAARRRRSRHMQRARRLQGQRRHGGDEEQPAAPAETTGTEPPPSAEPATDPATDPAAPAASAATAAPAATADPADADGASEEKAAAAAEVLQVEASVASLEAQVTALREAKPDPELKRAVAAALSAEQELLAAQSAEQQWNATVARLTASAEMWGNVSSAEEAMQHNISARALGEGEGVALETERLERLRAALAHTTENVKTSLVSDGILHASKAAREALVQLREYERERTETKEEFIASLGAIGPLMRQYAEESNAEAKAGAAGRDSAKSHATHALIGTKQSLARIQRERLLELNNTIVEQRALLRERHAQLERLTQSQQPDNATSPSPHTRELLAKERALQKMVEMLARNVSAASASLAADRAKADALAQEAGKMVDGPESAANEKLRKARLRLANATRAAVDAAALESRLRQTAEDATLVEDAERKKKVGKLEARLASAQEQLTLAKEKLEGEIEAEEASKAADEAAETAETVLSDAQESDFEAKAREVQATQATGAGDVAPWDEGSGTGEDKTSKAARHIRRIVGKLLWSEGHDAAAQAASREVVETVQGLISGSGSGSSKPSTSVEDKVHDEIQAQEAKLRGAQSTEHLDGKMAEVKETMQKNARFKSTRKTVPEMKTVATGPASLGELPKKTAENPPKMRIVPNHCFDGEKNKGEDGPDCGGACARKCGEYKPSFTDHSRSSKFHRASPMDRTDLVKGETRSPIMVKHLVTAPEANTVALLEETKAEEESVHFSSRESNRHRRNRRQARQQRLKRQRQQRQQRLRRLDRTLTENDY